jgi:hypothetical protein
LSLLPRFQIQINSILISIPHQPHPSRLIFNS